VKWMAGVAAAGVVLVTVGSLAGCGSASTDLATPGTEALSERQMEMVDVVRDYVAAWQDTNGEEAASYMTSNAVFEYHEQGWTFNVADGSLQSRITDGPYDTLRTFEPMMVYNERIVLAGTIDSEEVDWVSVIRFTPRGEVKIVSETLFFGP